MSETAGRRFTMATLVLVNLLWAAQYPAYKIAGDHMSPAALNFWTLTLGIALLTPFLWWKRRGPDRQPRPIRWRAAIVQFVILGLFGIMPPSVALSWGIAHSTASNAAILSLTIPVLMTLLGIVMLGERVTLLRVASLCTALAGTLVISRADLSGDLLGSRLLAGNAVILLAGLGSAFYNAYGKVLLKKFGELEVLIGGYTVGAVCCMVVSAVWDAQPFYRIAAVPMAAWLAVGVLGAFTWGIAMVLWMWVLKRLAASQASVSIYLLSIFGVLLSAVTLREKIGAAQIAGGAIVFLATYLTSEYENRRPSG